MVKDDMQNIKDILYNGKKIKKTKSTEILEIYKIYLSSIEKTAERRQNANSFFMTLNTGVLAIIGFIFNKDVSPDLKPLYLILPIAGILSSFFWLKLVTSYRQLNKGKFEILSLIEEDLSIAVYKAEWIELGEGKDKKKYHQITSLEKWIPILFIILYGILLIYFIYLFIMSIR